MNEYYEEVAEKIENGEYFKDAHEWYFKKFIYPITERSLFVIFTIIALFIFSIAMRLVLDAFPLTKTFPVFVEMNDTAESYSRLTPLGTQNEKDSNQILARFLVKKFIKANEEYNFDRNFQEIKANSRYVKQFGSENITKRFLRSVSKSNPRSKLRRYRTHTVRRIKFNNRSIRVVSMEENKTKTKESKLQKYNILNIFTEEKKQSKPTKYKAYVDFWADELNIEYPDRNNRTKWKAEIDFSFRDVDYNYTERKFVDFGFQVTGYRVSEEKKDEDN